MAENVDMHIGGYHLTEAIGTGGMGSVFRATVEADGKCLPKGSIVAVKLLHPHLRTVEEFVKRFHREARLAAAIDHPNVVRVLDEGVHEKRHHYIVMEYAEGLKLNDLIGDSQPLSPQQTIEVMNQICEALKAAASVADPDDPARTRSLVHRDIKPDNIIIQPLDRRQLDTMTQTGDKTALASIRVKLLDFGLAKDVKALSTILSQTGQSLGTPAYMSPEQCKGDDVDQRSDIYSLGVVAYHMITGTQPFAGPTTVAYATQHAQEIPPDILKRNPLCPKNLADCIYRCLAKSPADRYTVPADLQADLARVAKGQSVARVYKFKKKGSFSHRKVAGIVASTLIVGALAAVAGWHFLTDSAKADLAQAIQQADVAIAAQDFAGAKKMLENAVAAVASRPDKAELTASANRRLQEIAPKAAQQEAQIRQRQEQAAEAAAKARHEQDALAAIADIKAKTAAGQYQQAIDAATAAIKSYADTPSGKELPDLIATATSKFRSEKEAQAAKEVAERQRQDVQAKGRQRRFIEYRDDGISAFSQHNYRAAQSFFERALQEQDDPDVKAKLEQCIERTTRQRIAVIDFTEKGDVGVKDAGQTVAELLLTKFGQDRYQLVERSQLDAILKEVDLSIAVVRDNPQKVYGKLKGVKYLVMGSVNRLGNITITARIVSVATGDVIQTAEVSAEDARGIQAALGELAKVLQMTPEEKKAYQQQRPSQTDNDRELTLDLGNNVTMKMALIPAGKFTMGSRKVFDSNNKIHTMYCDADEWPQREVTISKPFYMGVYEVTQEQYEQVMGKNPSTFKGPKNPVKMVTWNDAVEFCRKLSQKTGKTVKLPTEAQWEYACRAGSKTLFSFGDDYGDLDDYAWHDKNSGLVTAPVGQKKPNAWGLYDMHGNVLEWCSDWYDLDYYSASGNDRDPLGPATGTHRILRGGGCINSSGCRSAKRKAYNPADTCDVFGFRVIVDDSPPAPAAPAVVTPAKQLTLDLGNNVTMKLALIPAGKFMMGSSEDDEDRWSPHECPQREVTISKPFYMGIYEVTQEQYEQVMGHNPSKHPGRQNPVDTASWEDAAEFCRKLSQKTGKTVKLPTEAQREYACRAGSKTRFGFGDNNADLGNYAWHRDNSDRKAHPVGQKKPNAWGLYDMHGNVSEWCSDWWDKYYYSKSGNDRDPQGPASGTARVIRGGSFTSHPRISRSAYREDIVPTVRSGGIGFRVVVDDSPPAPAAPAVVAPAKQLTLDLGNNVSMKLALIPDGKFTMGSTKDEKARMKDDAKKAGLTLDFSDEGPQREVTIGKPYYMGIFHVTRGQFDQFVSESGYKTEAEKAGKAWGYDGEKEGYSYKKTGFDQTDEHPVVNVSWNDAVEFCKWLSKRAGKTVRLPTEAQWEYACRAGTTTAYPWGDDPDDGKGWCNAADQTAKKKFPNWASVFSWEDSYAFTSPVGKFKPNKFGLYDMIGNVWEWCSDWHDKDYYSANANTQDPQGPGNGTLRVLRGGYWGSTPQGCRSAYRNWSGVGGRNDGIGFRVAVDSK